MFFIKKHEINYNNLYNKQTTYTNKKLFRIGEVEFVYSRFIRVPLITVKDAVLHFNSMILFYQ